ncbi:MAG: 16S rRNA (uracil(1498)-N(3))-methyltransferase [Gammaproteobacteria bacterium]|nr:16S rRNA (uracil(1498)-N(3))-methyltransferase [Gammaproteobacteria bacterium]
MRRIRAYQDQPLQAGMQVQLDARVSHHWLQVLRLRTGEPVWLFNGDGQDYPGQLQVTGKRSGSVLLQTPQVVCGNRWPRLLLCQGMCRGERMDLVLQKATELGVDEIQPLQTQHSQLHLHGTRLRKRMQHWQQVIISACEQSGRACLPSLHPPLPVSALQSAGQHGLCLQLYPGAETSLAACLRAVSAQTTLRIAVGPEGGFSDEENDQFDRIGFVRVSLGNNVLRTETAAMAAVALVKLGRSSETAESISG